MMEQELRSILRRVKNRIFEDKYIEEEIAYVIPMIEATAKDVELTCTEMLEHVSEYIERLPNAHPVQALWSLSDITACMSWKRPVKPTQKRHQEPIQQPPQETYRSETVSLLKRRK